MSPSPQAPCQGGGPAKHVGAGLCGFSLFDPGDIDAGDLLSPVLVKDYVTDPAGEGNMWLEGHKLLGFG